METAATAGTPGRTGRRLVTSRDELSYVALELFNTRGFDDVTIDEIATAAGIGRRTFFRYFPSKNDLPWGDFQSLLDRMAVYLRTLPEDLPLGPGLCAAVLEFNSVPPEEVAHHRQRMELLLYVPTLLAHSTLRYAAWRQVVAAHVGSKLGISEQSLKPQAVAWALLGLCLAAYEQWLQDKESDLTEVLRQSLQLVEGVLDKPAQDKS